MSVFICFSVCAAGWLFNWIQLYRDLSFFQFKWVSFYQRARALHSELILHLPSNTLPFLTTLPLRVVVKSVSWNRAWVYLFCFMRECVKFYLRYLFAPPGPFLFCLREIFASLFYLLTLYNIVFTFFFCLVYDLLFVLTKPNWTFLLYYSCFFLFCHQVRRLLLLSCFLFLSAAHHVHCWRHDLFACVRVYWWARLLWWERACLRVCEWGC